MRESLGSLPKSVKESLGLYRDRLHPADRPAGVDGWWQISSQSDACTAATDMVAQLAEHGWPTLTRLLDRRALIESIRSGGIAPHLTDVLYGGLRPRGGPHARRAAALGPADESTPSLLPSA